MIDRPPETLRLRLDREALATNWRALDETITAAVAASAERGIALTLPRLSALFSLSPVETQILVICVADRKSVV